MTGSRERAAAAVCATLVLFTVLAGDFWRNTLSWYGFGVVAAGLLVWSVVLLVRSRPRVRFWKLPVPLIGFLLFATASLAWSQYQGVTVLGVGLQWATTAGALFLALALTWREFVDALHRAIRAILGLSLVFELVVSAFVRQPLLPFFTDYGDRDIPKAFYWSRNLLFEGGRIQGIVGNANLLGMVALLGLIVFGVRLAAMEHRRRRDWAWVLVAVATLALTKSSTVLVATAVTGLVLVLALVARRLTPRGRIGLLAGIAVSALVSGAAVASFAPRVIGVFGKGCDLTGRTDIWAGVIDLAVQRPVLGWGWSSYWAPWVEPFSGLAVRNGVEYLQAHNAYLDVWFQLGIVGAVLFVCLVVSTVARAWWAAIDRPQRRPGLPLPFSPLDLLPLLVMAALVAQSITESRLLIEGGWVLLVTMAVATKVGTARSESVSSSGRPYSPALVD
ncbi:O-antigen ligase family protein [Microbacteriaceae bacterium 4G12]